MADRDTQMPLRSTNPLLCLENSGSRIEEGRPGEISDVAMWEATAGNGPPRSRSKTPPRKIQDAERAVSSPPERSRELARHAKRGAPRDPAFHPDMEQAQAFWEHETRAVLLEHKSRFEATAEEWMA